MTTRSLSPLSHDEALEFAGLYVLDALTPDEKRLVDEHLATCAESHAEFDELGAVVPALASLAEPVEAPARLKTAVVDAYRTEMRASASRDTKPWTMDVIAPAPAARAARGRMPSWMGWAAAGVAVLLLAVLSVVGLNLRAQADHANQVADQMSKAIAAMTAPGAEVALLHGSGSAAGINGFAAFPSNQGGYMVMTGVPAAPSGKTYQAWYIVDGTPTSAGTMASDADGNVVASGLQPLPGTDVIAVTVEPAGGSAQPTGDPIVVGTVTTNS